MEPRARARSSNRFGFPKTARLLRRAEFLKVQERGQQIPADCVLVLVLDNARADHATRVGFTVSSKVGNAVVRNRIRRILRELTRTRRAAFPKGLDMVLIARQSAARAEYPAFVRSFDKLEAELKRRAAK